MKKKFAYAFACRMHRAKAMNFYFLFCFANWRIQFFQPKSCIYNDTELNLVYS